MEDNYKHDEFEEFLQDELRNQRMYPSDAVWRDINKKLHGDKKWPGLTVAALALLTATISISVYFAPKPNIFTLNPTIEPLPDAQVPPSTGNNIVSNFASAAPFSKPARNLTVTPQPAVEAKIVKLTDILRAQNKIAPPEELVQAAKRRPVEKLSAAQPALSVTESEQAETISNAEEVLASEIKAAEEIKERATLENITQELVTNNQTEKINPVVSSSKRADDKKTVDNLINKHKEEIDLAKINRRNAVRNRFSFLVYVAPSRSYRKLFEDRSVLKGDDAGPVSLNYVADVNNVVRHRPGTGFEAGVSFRYNTSEKVRIKTGLQFNVRQYSIEAYRANTELASIALVGSRGVDTIRTIAMYRTNNGYSQDELVNRYYQIAMPIGLEWEILGNKRIQLNVAGSIQPTYLLNHNAYILTTNFKNYAENPDMVRRWNLNSNIEAFVTFLVGDFKWQLGPQLRYQPYSTFIPEYPIKEHLLDYGLKLGFSKSF